MLNRFLEKTGRLELELAVLVAAKDNGIWEAEGGGATGEGEEKRVKMNEK